MEMTPDDLATGPIRQKDLERREPTVSEEQRAEWATTVGACRDGWARFGCRPGLIVTVAERLDFLEAETATLRAELAQAREDRDGFKRARDFWIDQWQDVLKQIEEWVDNGVSRPDMAAYLRETALPTSAALTRAPAGDDTEGSGNG